MWEVECLVFCKCQSRAVDRKCWRRPEEGPVSSEELPPVPHLEGKRRCGFTKKQRECYEQRESPYQQHWGRNKHATFGHMEAIWGRKGQGQGIDLTREILARLTCLCLQCWLEGRGRILFVVLLGWSGWRPRLGGGRKNGEMVMVVRDVRGNKNITRV